MRGVHEPRSKMKVKKKPGWQQREAEYNEWLKSHGVDPNAKKSRKKEFIPLTTTKQEVYRRETQYIPSKSSSSMGNATKKETPVYSGDYLVGIATMHKSNLVPVGRGDDPESYAKMRRG